VVLITLSVVGIIFIQMSWIDNAISLKQNQRVDAIANATREIKRSMHNLFLIRSGYITDYEETKHLVLQNFTVLYLTPEDLRQSIGKAFEKYNIKEPFEYSVTNIFQIPIAASPEFSSDYLNNSTDILLTP